MTKSSCRVCAVFQLLIVTGCFALRAQHDGMLWAQHDGTAKQKEALALPFKYCYNDIT